MSYVSTSSINWGITRVYLDNSTDSLQQNATYLSDGISDNFPLLTAERTLNGNFSNQSVIKESDDDKMAPKYDDLFIEPAGDYDVVYGDYNST
ncbi:hypothetical protein Ddc_11039 [Ditylenchus destructor]|nr:hypothetical protein Ddc_11039 [Ditylenchus destructor]